MLLSDAALSIKISPPRLSCVEGAHDESGGCPTISGNVLWEGGVTVPQISVCNVKQDPSKLRVSRSGQESYIGGGLRTLLSSRIWTFYLVGTRLLRPHHRKSLERSLQTTSCRMFQPPSDFRSKKKDVYVTRVNRGTF